MKASARGLHVRLAQTREEVAAAQRLRYKVFYEQWGARPDAAMRAQRRDIDAFDEIADHLIVIDPERTDVAGRVVGNYRLLRREQTAPATDYYSSAEFDIRPITRSDARLLELGRSCVLPEYRTLPVLQMMWQAIAAYVGEHGIDIMFGCASLRGTDVSAVEEQLAYLHHYHRAHETLRPRALERGFIDMNLRPKEDIDPRRARAGLESLIKGYLRLGASVGDGACIDHQFNSIDVCIVMPTGDLARKYLRHYERANRQNVVNDAAVGVVAEPRRRAAGF